MTYHPPKPTMRNRLGAATKASEFALHEHLQQGHHSHVKRNNRVTPPLAHPDQRPEIMRLPLFSYDRLLTVEPEKGWILPTKIRVSNPDLHGDLGKI